MLALSLFLKSLLFCVLQENVNSTELGMESVPQTSNNTNPPTTTHIPLSPVTMGPSTKVKYKLVLTNPGPSVLDSTLAFQAELQPEEGEVFPPDLKFSYQWMTMADSKVHKTTDKYKATIPLTFASAGNASVKAGDYTMTVVATEESNPSRIIAFQTKKFVLTKQLNGHLTLQQQLDYQRLNNTFSTAQNFIANAIVLDHFEQPADPHYQYYWYENETLKINTPHPELVTTVSKAGNLTLRTQILATMAFKYGQPQRDGSIKEMVFDTDKIGIFEERLHFKDPLLACYIDRVDAKPNDRDIEIGVPAVINVTCEGSPPTAVCLNFTRYNGSAPVTIEQNCKPQIFVDSLHHQVHVRLNQTGWHDVHFFLYNDVSRKRYTLAYYAYDPTSTNIPALVVPIVFVTLGLVVVLTGAVYIMRLRKKPQVEVADFDFHPTLNETSTSNTSGMRLSLVANTLKYMMTRRKFTSSRTPKSRGASPDSLSELEHSGSSTRTEVGAHLYEAL